MTSKRQEILKQANDILGRGIEKIQNTKKAKEEREYLATTITEGIRQALDTQLQALSQNNLALLSTIKEAIAGIEIKVPEIQNPSIILPELKAPDVQVNVPEAKVSVEVPPIKVPAPEVTVNIPEIKLPEINVPAPEINIPAVSLKDIDYKNPLPVTLRTPDGKPFEMSAAIAGGGGGGPANGIFDRKRNSVAFQATTSVATSATQVSGAKSRKSIVLVHESADPMYIGTNTELTTSNGFPIVANQIFGFDDYTGPVYAIISNGAASSTISLRSIEV